MPPTVKLGPGGMITTMGWPSGTGSAEGVPHWVFGSTSVGARAVPELRTVPAGISVEVSGAVMCGLFAAAWVDEGKTATIAPAAVVIPTARTAARVRRMFTQCRPPTPLAGRSGESRQMYQARTTSPPPRVTADLQTGAD